MKALGKPPNPLLCSHLPATKGDIAKGRPKVQAPFGPAYITSALSSEGIIPVELKPR